MEDYILATFDMSSQNDEDKFDLYKMLDADVDLGQFFSKVELDEMVPDQQRRYKNIVKSYGILSYMGLPAVKLDFMDRHTHSSILVDMKQKDNADPSPERNSDVEKWKRDIEEKKEQRNKLFLPSDFPNEADLDQKCSLSSHSMKRKLSSEEISELPAKKVNSIQENKTRHTFMNLDVPDDDHFLYCDYCDQEYASDCPKHGALTYITDAPVSGNIPDRALYTLPKGLIVKESSIQGAGLGVFAEEYVPARTKFGPYGGVTILNSETSHSTGYCWQVNKDGKLHHIVDAGDKQNSNWMRYVNCANTEAEQNLVAFQHEGEIYYRTSKPITPDTELLVYYGLDCASDLGACRDVNALLERIYVYNTERYPCIYCGANFRSPGSSVLHLLRSHAGRMVEAGHVFILEEWLRNDEFRRSKYNYGGIVVNGKARKKRKESKDGSRSNLDNVGNIQRNEEKGVSQTAFEKNPVNQLPVGTHTEENIYNCDFCEYTSSKKKNLVRHRKKHTGEKPYKCYVCKFAYSRKENLVIHMRTHTGEGKPYKCDVCEYSCNRKADLVKHMRLHTGEKPFNCDVCGYKCHHKGLLVTHMRIHAGEKPYMCDYCGYTCIKKGRLVIHKRTHTGEKPYSCNVCEYACNEKCQLVSHMKVHTEEKPYKCNVCEYASKYKHTFDTHMRTHSGEKPYKCEYCLYACKERGSLVKHVRIHTGEKPYKCNICDYRGNQKISLVKHMRTHTGEKPYKCDVCEFACNEKSSLVKHKRKHTDMPM